MPDRYDRALNAWTCGDCGRNTDDCPGHGHDYSTLEGRAWQAMRKYRERHGKGAAEVLIDRWYAWADRVDLEY